MNLSLVTSHPDTYFWMLETRALVLLELKKKNKNNQTPIHYTTIRFTSSRFTLGKSSVKNTYSKALLSVRVTNQKATYDYVNLPLQISPAQLHTTAFCVSFRSHRVY